MRAEKARAAGDQNALFEMHGGFPPASGCAFDPRLGLPTGKKSGLSSGPAIVRFGKVFLNSTQRPDRSTRSMESIQSGGQCFIAFDGAKSR
jgi:hypothetical protein